MAIELLVYMLFFALSIMWSAEAVKYSENYKGILFSFLAMTTWFILATMHLALAYASMFLGAIWMFYGIGVFFLIFGFLLLIQSFRIRREQKEWEVK